MINFPTIYKYLGALNKELKTLESGHDERGVEIKHLDALQSTYQVNKILRRELLYLNALLVLEIHQVSNQQDI